jgi:hypothetical protein
MIPFVARIIAAVVVMGAFPAIATAFPDAVMGLRIR